MIAKKIPGLDIDVRQVSPFQTCCYLLVAGAEAVVIDPGDEGSRILQWLDTKGATPVMIWLTHAHADHIAAAGEIRAATGAPIHLHRGDLPLYEGAAEFARQFGWNIADLPPPDKFWQGGDILAFGGCSFEVVETPGHSPGGVTLVCHREGKAVLAFSGDTIFAGSIGRTDFPGGDFDQLAASIRTRIYTLPGEVVLFPGHGGSTTVGEERAGNAFVRA